MTMWGFRPGFSSSPREHFIPGLTSTMGMSCMGFLHPTMSTQYAYPQHVVHGNDTYPNMYPNNGYPAAYGLPSNGGLGFAFKKRFERVDWKKIASADIEAISRNLDFNALQENIMNVTFCNLESEIDTRMVDPNFIKLFKLAQLTIEYLLHSQDYLSGLVTTLESKLKKALEEHNQTKSALEKNKEELTEVKKESHKRKKMLMAQQQIIQAGVNSYNKCPFCSKAFVNSTFLQSHLQRRHGDYIPNYNSMVASQAQESHNAPAPVPVPVPQPVTIQSQPPDNNSLEMERELKKISDRLQLTESQLVDERNARNSLLEKEREKELKQERQMQQEMRNWQEDQHELHRQELDKVRDMFMRELKEMNEKYDASQQTLDDLQRMQAKRSNLGAMEDDVETEKNLLEKQREELAMMKEQLQQQMNATLDDKVEEINLEREDLEAQYQSQLESVEREKEEERQRAIREQEERTEREREARKHEQEAKQQAENEKKTGAGAMYDDSEDETEAGQTTEFTTEFDGTSTYTTTRGTMSMGQFTNGTLSMTEPPSERLQHQMKKNPNLLKALKNEIMGTLEMELKKRGISETAKGLSEPVFKNKLELLKNERQQLAKKYRNIYDIRQQYIDTVEQQAKEKYRSTLPKGRPSTSRPKSPTAPPMESKPHHSAPASPARAAKASAPATASGNTKNLTGSLKNAPVPAPRATSPVGRGIPTQGGLTRSSMGSSRATTTASSTWTDDDSEYDSDDDDDEDTSVADADPIERRPPAQIPPSGGNRGKQPVTKDESDDYWDDISDMIDDPAAENKPKPKPSHPAPIISKSAPQPRGHKVAELSRSIELQLSGRRKKPVGGVSVSFEDEVLEEIERQNKAKQAVEEPEDDSLPSVSSMGDEKQPDPPRPRTRTPITRSSNAETDQSNTYGTSVWGSSSRAAAHHGNTAHNSTSKTSMALEGDSDVWDTDEDEE